jgi:hypothetical protein
MGTWNMGDCSNMHVRRFNEIDLRILMELNHDGGITFQHLSTSFRGCLTCADGILRRSPLELSCRALHRAWGNSRYANTTKTGRMTALAVCRPRCLYGG